MTEEVLSGSAAPLVKAGWKGGTLHGGYLCPVKDCGRRMSLHLLDEHLSSSLYGGHGLSVEWTIRVIEVPKDARA